MDKSKPNDTGTPGTRRSARRSRVSWLVMFLGFVAIIVGGTLATLHNDNAQALAPCLAHTNTTEELTFLGQLQAWRDQNIAGSFPLTLSAPLNAAAAGYAQFLANTPGAQGHYADPPEGQFPWADRAVQCGYPSNEAAGAEGLAVVDASGVIDVTGTQALTIMAAENGSSGSIGGIWVPAFIGANVECVGVAKMTGLGGTQVAWVVELFATFDGTCPQAVLGGGGGSTPSPSASASSSATSSPTLTATASPTSTPTMTPTPSPTPSPTPTPRADGATLTLNPGGWNLVTLPAANSLRDLLYRATGCFTEVYQQQGALWFDYAPGLPAYANDLTSSNGGAFWIKATAQACGAIHL